MLELLSQEVFVELTVKEILWGYENPLIELAKGIFPPEKQFPFDKFGLFLGVIKSQIHLHPSMDELSLMDLTNETHPLISGQCFSSFFAKFLPFFKVECAEDTVEL